MIRFAKIWAGLAIALPTLIAGILIFSPMLFITPGTRIEELAMTIGFRNLAISIILAVALFTQPARVIGFLLLVRGLTEVGDTVATYLSRGHITMQTTLTLVLAAISFAAAYYLITNDTKSENKNKES